MTDEQKANLAIMNACIAYADWEDSGSSEDGAKFIAARDALYALIQPASTEPAPNV